MPFGNLDLKKTYYYVIAAMAFFILMWGVIDLASSAAGILIARQDYASIGAPTDAAQDSPEKSEQFFDAFYQKKMLYDRLWDSVARVLVAGAIFAYFRSAANKLENQA